MEAKIIITEHQFRQYIIDRFDELEKQILSRLDKIQNDLDTLHTAVVTLQKLQISSVLD